VAAVADFDGDGTADILWQRNTGLVHIWFIEAAAFTGVASLGVVTSDWQIR
jgi:hypothetical protein